MKSIGLYSIDSLSPNFALMKIAANHKSHRDNVRWYSPIEHNLFDTVYASSIFTWSEKGYTRNAMICGGTGFDLTTTLPDAIEDGEPDYSLYPNMPHALGFLTRGCIRKCPECFVPEKEGAIRPYRDIETIAQGRRDVVLMDNNVLAHPHGLAQIERIAEGKYRVDFNQGLDARLITPDIAKLLSRVLWLKPLRLACDSEAMIEPARRAVELLREYGCTPRNYFVYVLVKDIPSALERVTIIRELGCEPFAQPYRDRIGTPATNEQSRFARWVNRKAIFYTVTWEDYE